jgi:predicted lysophospholipase L1 biosynthesis ABC-type transport system permease subunit
MINEILAPYAITNIASQQLITLSSLSSLQQTLTLLALIAVLSCIHHTVGALVSCPYK